MRIATFPLWVSLPATAGLAAMSAFLPDLEPWQRWTGFSVGAALFVWAVIGALWHLYRSSRPPKATGRRFGLKAGEEPKLAGSFYKQHRTPEEARAVVDAVLDPLKPKFSDDAWKGRLRDMGLNAPRRGRIGRAQDPDIDLLVQEVRRAERKADNRVPAPPHWIPFHEALHYLVYDSDWGAKQPAVAGEEEFNRVVCAEVRERLARGEIAARGWRGWDDESLPRATEAIPPEFWTDSFFLPWGEIALARDNQGAACKHGGGGATYRAIIVNGTDVHKVWRVRRSRGPTLLSTAVEETRAKCAEGSTEIERLRTTLKSPAPDKATRASVADLWRKTDPLQLYQAACLWVGESPPSDENGHLPAAAVPMLVQLKKGVLDGTLPYANDPERTKWQLTAVRAALNHFRTEPVTIPSGVEVDRAGLRAFAEAIGERPDFLFGGEE